MDNKIVALIIIVVLIVIAGVYVFATQNTNKTNTTLNNTNNTTQIIHNQTKHNNIQNDTTKVKISAKQAQENAIGAEKDLTGVNATAGTPVLFKWTENNLHTWAWDVPLYDAATKKSLGALYVDAMTGEIIMNE